MALIYLFLLFLALSLSHYRYLYFSILHILSYIFETLVNYRRKELPVTTSIIISKIVALGVGLACLAIAFLAQHLGGLLQVLNIFFIAIRRT